VKSQWGERHQGVSKAHKVALLEGGGKYIQAQNTIKDMDWRNLKLGNRDVILGVYGMPLSVMGISENVNKANAEAGDYTFARWIVKPRLDRMVSKLNEQLIVKFKKAENLKIGYEEVVKETVDQKRELAESGMRAGYLTINEARELRGMDPLDSGNVLLVPLNLVPTPIVGDILPPPPEPNPFEEEEEETEVVEESKSLTEERKRLFWDVYAQKTARQEGMFVKVSGNVFDEQKKHIIDHLEKTGEIPTYLDDERIANKFQPAIELVYESAFEDAV